MIFMLDNYDSFTYNLVQYLEELGAKLLVARNDQITVPEVMAMNPAGIVISPGPGRPEDAGILMDLIAEAAGSIPLLGVCLGHQGIAQSFGGRIDYAPSLVHGKMSWIEHDGSRLFAGIESPIEATRYHSLAVDRQSLPDELTVTAWTSDGVVMALAHKAWPVYGVQFHPESIMTGCGKKILGNFLESLSDSPLSQKSLM
jgi:anthranilate synthase/aminodeoxychorismate synthase-like glutamine amidotransferase